MKLKQLLDRLIEARGRIGKMCSEGRGPRMSIPVDHVRDDDVFINDALRDAEAALRAMSAPAAGERAMMLQLDSVRPVRQGSWREWSWLTQAISNFTEDNQKYCWDDIARHLWQRGVSLPKPPLSGVAPTTGEPSEAEPPEAPCHLNAAEAEAWQSGWRAGWRMVRP